MAEEDWALCMSEFEGGLFDCGKDGRIEFARHDDECSYVVRSKGRVKRITIGGSQFELVGD